MPLLSGACAEPHLRVVLHVCHDQFDDIDADLAETETARECKIFKNIHANILNLYTVIAAFMCILLVMTVPYQG